MNDAVGKVRQVIGPVVDVGFPEGQLPSVLDAVLIERDGGARLVLEVAQHLGDDTVRCVAMAPTDGVARGTEVRTTGAPISAASAASRAVKKTDMLET